MNELLCYFNMFHLLPSPLSLRVLECSQCYLQSFTTDQPIRFDEVHFIKSTHTHKKNA
jgi:hypothetical protein